MPVGCGPYQLLTWSAALLTPSSCAFCTCAGSPQNGELGAQLPLRACLCHPTILSHPADRTETPGMGPGRALLLCFQTLRNNSLWPERILTNLKLKGAF